MRQITSALFLLFGLLTTAFAQDPPFVGEWTTSFIEKSETKYNYVFRIEIQDGQYYVRGKTIVTFFDGEVQPTVYHPLYKVDHIEGNTMVVTEDVHTRAGEYWGTYTLRFTQHGPYLLVSQTYTGHEYKWNGNENIDIWVDDKKRGWATFYGPPYTLELLKNDGW